jgi:hypothetical protein
MTRNPRRLHAVAFPPLLVCVLAAAACGDDDAGTEADRLGVGAECESDDDCLQSTRDGGISQQCLRQFKGGYCGIEDCTRHEDCPEHSACVAHDDGTNYCFRLCADKPECNLNRSLENEANCSSSIDYVGSDEGKACVPPSGGD